MQPVRAVQAVFEQDNDEFIVSYIFLRRAIGVIGIALPFVLVLGNHFIYKRNFFEPSISDFYYTSMRTVFTGSLCAIAMFLLAYRGKKKIDSILGTFACLFALGVAFFPTSRDLPKSCEPTAEYLQKGCVIAQECLEGMGCFFQQATIIGNLHVIFAGALFITLAFFSFFLFTRNDKPGRPTEKKKTRNVIYRACGIIIFVAIVLIAVAWAYTTDAKHPEIEALRPTYWLEAVAIVAFGVSWLIKGETLFADKSVGDAHAPDKSADRSVDKS